MLLIVTTAFTHTQKAVAQGDETITFQTFYDELSPYGTWIEDPDYGAVWLPDVNDDFRPYANAGHWALTDYGNTWVSDYEWGWAPFHYGRWRFDDYYGWEWIPGYEWGPAWVNWRSGDGYYGWAPLSPGIDIDVAFGGYNVPDFYWTFAPQTYITSPRIYNYYLPRTRVGNIISRTNIIQNTYNNRNIRYITGPRINDIRTVTRNNNIRVYHINNSGRPGITQVNNTTINIYRPAVNRGGNARPPRIINAQAYRNANPNSAIANRYNGTNNGSRAADFSRTARTNNNYNYNNSNIPVRRGDYRNDNRNNNNFPANRPYQQPANGQSNVNNAPVPNAGQPAGTPADRNRFGRPNPNSGENNNGTDNGYRRYRFNRDNGQNPGQPQPNNGQLNQQQNATQQQQLNQQQQQQNEQRRQQWQQRWQEQQQRHSQQQQDQQGQAQQQQMQQQQAEQQRQARQMQQQQQVQRQQQMEQQRQQQQMQRQQEDQQRQQMQQQQAEQQRRQQEQQQRQQQDQQRQQEQQQRQQQEQQQRQQQQMQRQQEQQQRQQQDQQQREQRRQAFPEGGRRGGRP
ncbi:hypothetical protein GCM10027037_22330 [Mucilaginibacter koreensis]